MDTLASAITPVDVLIPEDQDVLRFRNLGTDERFMANDFQYLVPAESLSDNPEFTFMITGGVIPRYTYLNQVFVSCKVRLMKLDPSSGLYVGTENEDNVAPCPFLIDSLFENCDIYLNDQRVTEDNQFRFYSAYISKRLFFPEICYDTYLEAEVAAPDRGQNYDSCIPTINKGFAWRKLWFQGQGSGSSKKAPSRHLLGCLSHSLSTLSSPIIQNVNICIKLRRNSDRRLIMTGPSSASDNDWNTPPKTYKLVIDHIALLVRRPIVSDKYFTHHSRMLKQGPAIYPYTRTMVNWTQINKDVSTYFTNELFRKCIFYYFCDLYV